MSTAGSPARTGQSLRPAVQISDARAEASRERSEVPRAENRRGQSQSRAECAQARPARAKASRAAGENAAEFEALKAALLEELALFFFLGGGKKKKVSGSVERCPDRARLPRRGRRLAPRPSRSVGRRTRSSPVPERGGQQIGLFVERFPRNGAPPLPPRRQRRALVRDGWRSQHRPWWSVRSAQPLSRRGARPNLARAAHPEAAPGRAGAPGRAPRRDAPRPWATPPLEIKCTSKPPARDGRRSLNGGATERTRARAPAVGLDITCRARRPRPAAPCTKPAAPWRPNEPDPMPANQLDATAMPASQRRPRSHPSSTRWKRRKLPEPAPYPKPNEPEARRRERRAPQTGRMTLPFSRPGKTRGVGARIPGAA